MVLSAASSDLATRAGGQMFFVQMPDLFTLDPTTGTQQLSAHDTVPDSVPGWRQRALALARPGRVL